MTAEIRNTWTTLNRVLTIINLSLFMVLTAQGFNYKEVKGKKVPVILNVLLLVFLSLGVYAAIYQAMKAW
ncbi:MAG: hypothetical protein LPK07_08955 [Hymenobacteraceae bacterium]|nr:hypothetical protein [Hymenobacteraceae bacterium]